MIRILLLMVLFSSNVNCANAVITIFDDVEQGADNQLLDFAIKDKTLYYFLKYSEGKNQSSIKLFSYKPSSKKKINLALGSTYSDILDFETVNNKVMAVSLDRDNNLNLLSIKDRLIVDREDLNYAKDSIYKKAIITDVGIYVVLQRSGLLQMNLYDFKGRLIWELPLNNIGIQVLSVISILESTDGIFLSGSYFDNDMQLSYIINVNHKGSVNKLVKLTDGITTRIQQISPDKLIAITIDKNLDYSTTVISNNLLTIEKIDLPITLLNPLTTQFLPLCEREYILLEMKSPKSKGVAIKSIKLNTLKNSTFEKLIISTKNIVRNYQGKIHDGFLFIGSTYIYLDKEYQINLGASFEKINVIEHCVQG